LSAPAAPVADENLFENAIEVFARGFAFTRSFTHPYEARRVEGMWALRDGPRKSGAMRSEEWIARGMEAGRIDAIARAQARGKFAVCVLVANGEDDREMRAAFKGLGYRLGTTEAFMVHSLKKIAAFESPAEIELVETQATADQLAKTARSRQILPQYLQNDGVMRQYVARLDGEIVGWVRSIVVGDATWCSNMFVVERQRRRGIGRALLSRMLRDDKRSGAKRAVLLASHTGAKLYPVVGYERIGMLYLFMPRK